MVCWMKEGEKEEEMARRDLAWGKVAILIMKGVPGEIILRLSAGRRRRWGMVMRSHEG